MEPFNNDEIRLVLLGHTGSGKSSTGNTILGRQEFGSHVGKMSFTQSCQCEESYLDGVRLKVIDTPGLFDTERSNSEISREIDKSLILAAPGPHAFLFVISLRDRFPNEAAEGIERIVRKFGENIYRHTVVVFTVQDTLTKSLSDYPSCLQKLISKSSNRYVAFNNEASDFAKNSKRQELLEILNHIDGYYTQQVRGNFIKRCLSGISSFIRRNLPESIKRNLPSKRTLLLFGVLTSLMLMCLELYHAKSKVMLL